MINLLRKFVSYIKYKQLIKKSILPKKTYLSRYSKIFILEGSSRNDIIIAENVMMCGELYSQNNGKIFIGEYSSIRHHSKIWAVNKIKIGKFVIISDNVIITDNNSHPISPSKRKEMILSGWSSSLWKWKYSESKPVVIEDNVWIGKDSKILKGVTIGKNSIVAMGSVVTKSVTENSIVAGNPAKIVKRLKD